MDTPTLVGTGFVVLGAVLWIVCAVYAYQNAPRLGRNAWVWAIICTHLRPARADDPVRAAEEGARRRRRADQQAKKKSEQDALYEVPKKHH